jgi:hypothetical protein
MPKWGGMAQLSRPFQIALLAFAVLVLAWFVVLHRPGAGSTSSSTPSVSAAAGGSSAAGSAAGGSSSIYHGSAPGVEGLTRAIQRAHGAVAQTASNAREVQSKAAQQPGEAAAGTSATGVSRGAASAARTHADPSIRTSAAVAARSHTQTHAARRHASSAASKAAPVAAQRTPRAQSGSAAAAPSHSAPAMQSVVAGELKQGKVVLVLFWNPHSSDDAAVAGQLRAAAHKLGHSVALHTALARQVDSFGSITRDIQVYQTPTLLIVNPHGQVTTVTGYTDAYSIEQAVAEARS